MSSSPHATPVLPLGEKILLGKSRASSGGRLISELGLVLLIERVEHQRRLARVPRKEDVHAPPDAGALFDHLERVLPTLFKLRYARRDPILQHFGERLVIDFELHAVL